MRIVRIAAIVLAVYIVLGVSLDVFIGVFQPQQANTAVLRTYDADGSPHDTVLALHDDSGQLWVESGHWFRGWYHRLLRNPDVELTRGGQTKPYRAVPVDTPEALARMERLMGRDAGAGYTLMRAMLLFAPIKPVRLDPRPAPTV